MAYTAYDFGQEEVLVAGGWARSLSVAQKARVEKVIGVKPDGAISDNIDAPDLDAWFLMDCMSASGVSFSILYDGEKRWVPLRRGAEITIGMPSATKKVVLEHMSLHDKSIFDAAIQAFKTA